MHEHDAQHRAVEAELVEDAGDVHVDRQVGNCLRQQEQQQDQRAPRQLEPRQRVAGGNGDREASTTVSNAIQMLVTSDAIAPPRGLKTRAQNVSPYSCGSLLGKYQLLGERPQQRG